MALVPRPADRPVREALEPYPIAGRFGPNGTVSIDPPRLEESPWRTKLERSAERRQCSLEWWILATPGIQSLHVAVRDRDGNVLRTRSVGKRADRVDYAALAERVSEVLMAPS